MGKKLLLLAATAFLLMSRADPLMGEDAFSFYGLKFSMTRDEAAAVFPSLEGNLVREPGHGMSTLELLFDREDLLIEIRAAYPRPEEKLAQVGARRALKEKFIVPVRDTYPDVEVTLDEYANQTAYTMIFPSGALREKNIEYYKGEFLRSLE